MEKSQDDDLTHKKHSLVWLLVEKTYVSKKHSDRKNLVTKMLLK
jgi:hypothetical protein